MTWGFFLPIFPLESFCYSFVRVLYILRMKFLCSDFIKFLHSIFCLVYSGFCHIRIFTINNQMCHFLVGSQIQDGAFPTPRLYQVFPLSLRISLLILHIQIFQEVFYHKPQQSENQNQISSSSKSMSPCCHFYRVSVSLKKKKKSKTLLFCSRPRTRMGESDESSVLY